MDTPTTEDGSWGVLARRDSGHDWVHGARSVRTFGNPDKYDGTDVYGMSFRPSQVTAAIMVGLAHGKSSTGNNDIEFAWRLTAAGSLEVVESGAVRMQAGSYAVDDLLELRLNSNGEVEYVHNKGVVYTSSRSTPLPLCVDTSFYEAGELKEVQWLLVAERGAVQWTDSGDVTEADGSITQQVRTAVGAITKVASSDSWDAGARSVFSFDAASEISGMSFVPTRDDKQMMLGLRTSGDSGVAAADIDFAWRLSSVGTLQVFESGVQRGNGFGFFSAGDLLEVRVNLYGEVEYAHNREVLYTSKQQPVYPLLVDSSLFDSGASAAQVRFTYC
jgi:hypothetical protein